MLDVELSDAAWAGDLPAWWFIGFVLSTITAGTFLAIGVVLLRGVRERGGARANPLAVGTGLIFITCGGGHLIHSLQLLWPFLWTSAIGTAARIHYLDWHLWAVDGFTAAAGILYWTQRRRFPELVAATAMYEDLQAGRRVALELNDTVVQNMNAARMALERGDEEQAKALLEAAREGT